MAEPKKTQVIAAADSAETKAADIDSKEPVEKTAPKKAAARKTAKKEAVKNDEAKAEKAPAKTAKKAGKKAAPKTAAKAGTKKAAAVSAAKSAAQPAAEEGKAAPAKRGRKPKAALTPVEEKAEESSLKELAEKEKTVLEPEKKEAEKPAPVKEEVKPAKPAEEAKAAPVKEEAKPAEAAAPAKEEAKPAKAEAPVKEEAEKIEAEANKESEKELAEKQKPAFEAKKPAKAKKAAPKKAAEAEEKAAPAKEEPVKEEIKAEEKAAPVEEIKVEAAPVEEVEVEAVPVEEITVEETAVPETDIAIKLGHYNSFNLDTLFAMAAAMGIQTTYDDIVKALLLTDDEAEIAEDLINEAEVKASDYNFEEDGYDISLIPVLIQRVADTMDFKASDFREIGKGIQQALDFEYSSDPMVNAEEYHRMFDLVRKILMLAQQKNIHNVADLEKVIPADIRGLIVKFMDHAYPLLKNWTYNDVRFYEGFINGILSQFDDLRTDLSNRALMDVADLMIVHGDYGLGDANYNYVIRENKLKDYIFYRFANIYKDIDLNKAKAIANDSLRYVDGRYTYYPEIIRILEMW